MWPLLCSRGVLFNCTSPDCKICFFPKINNWILSNEIVFKIKWHYMWGLFFFFFDLENINFAGKLKPKGERKTWKLSVSIRCHHLWNLLLDLITYFLQVSRYCIVWVLMITVKIVKVSTLPGSNATPPIIVNIASMAPLSWNLVLGYVDAFFI